MWPSCSSSSLKRRGPDKRLMTISRMQTSPTRRMARPIGVVALQASGLAAGCSRSALFMATVYHTINKKATSLTIGTFYDTLTFIKKEKRGIAAEEERSLFPERVGNRKERSGLLMSTTLSLGLLILRLGAGLTLTGHGLQKRFG